MKIIGLSGMFFLLSVIGFGQTPAATKSRTACYTYNYPESFKAYSGRYRLDDFNLLEVHYDQGNLLLKPLFWNSMQILQEVQRDSFLSQGRETLRFKFFRNVNGPAEAAGLNGFQAEKGQDEKINGQKEPLELILSGEKDQGTRQLMAKHAGDTAALVYIATKLNVGFCTKYAITEKYLQVLSAHFPDYAPLYAALGNSYVLLGRRAKGIAAFKKSLKLDPHNEESMTSLQLLHVKDYPKKQMDSAFKLPFDLKEVFKKPGPDEIEKVEMDWASRDLSA